MAITDHIIPAGILRFDGRDVGNTGETTIAVDEEEKSVPNARGGGGNSASNSRVKAVNFSTEIYNPSPENMAVTLRAATTAITAGAVSDESLSSAASLDRLVRTVKMIDTSVPPVVTSDPAGTTYVEDTDYTVTSSGIIPLSTGSIPVSTALLVSYTSVASTKVEALTEAATEIEVSIEGLNEDTGKPFRFIGYKWKPSAAERLALISGDYTSMPLSGEILQDLTKTGVGISKYMTLEL